MFLLEILGLCFGVFLAFGAIMGFLYVVTHRLSLSEITSLLFYSLFMTGISFYFINHSYLYLMTTVQTNKAQSFAVDFMRAEDLANLDVVDSYMTTDCAHTYHALDSNRPIAKYLHTGTDYNIAIRLDHRVYSSVGYVFVGKWTAGESSKFQVITVMKQKDGVLKVTNLEDSGYSVDPGDLAPLS